MFNFMPEMIYTCTCTQISSELWFLIHVIVLLLPLAGDSEEKLLVSYVRDVWDKFHDSSKELAGRHRLEVETLWLTQVHQWRERLNSESSHYCAIMGLCWEGHAINIKMANFVYL